MLRLLEDLDDIGIITYRDIYKTLEMIERHGLYRALGKTNDQRDVEEILKRSYVELLQQRAHHLTQP